MKLLEYKPDIFITEKTIDVIEYWKMGIDGKVYVYKITNGKIQVRKTPYNIIPFVIIHKYKERVQ